MDTKLIVMLRSSYLTQADYSSWFMSDLDPYDQYEVSVPLEVAGTCLTEVCYEEPSRLWNVLPALSPLIKHAAPINRAC